MAAMDPGGTFAAAVRESGSVDPYPTLERLAAGTGLDVAAVIHHALVRYVSAGSDALLSLEPAALRDLIEARRREDWRAVAGIIDWLEAGL